MLFNPSSYNNIENLSNEFNTIIFSIYKKDTIYYLKDNIEIEPYLKNNLNSPFIIIYSEKYFESVNLQNRKNLKNIIADSKIIAPHLREYFFNIIKTESVVPDIKNETTQQKFIKDIDNFITLYSKINRFTDLILKQIPSRHFAGAKGTKFRTEFETTSKHKTEITAINAIIKKHISQIKCKECKGLFYDETVSHFRIYVSNFLKQLKSNDTDITAPKHLKEKKSDIINFIYNEIILNDIYLTSTNEAEAKKYFKNIYNNMRYLNLYTKDKKNNQLNLSIKNFIEVDSITQIESEIKSHLPTVKTTNSNAITFNL